MTQTSALMGLLTGIALAAGQAPKDPPKEPAEPSTKETPAAEHTRSKLLKAKVTVSFTDAPVGEILKEFAHQAEEHADGALMWAYAPGSPFAKKVKFAAKDQPVEAALDKLLTQAGGGYVVVSRDGDKYDGWVRLTAGGERGVAPPPATPAEEEEAAAKLALAKKLLDAGKPDSAKPVLEIVARKFPTTKAGAEARELLAKVGKPAEKDK